MLQRGCGFQGTHNVLLYIRSVSVGVCACTEHHIGVVNDKVCRGSLCVQLLLLICICLQDSAYFRKTHNVFSLCLTLADLTQLIPQCQVSICLEFISHTEYYLVLSLSLSLVQEPSRWSSVPVQEGCEQGGGFSLPWERGRIQSSTMKVNRVKPIGPLCIHKIQNKRFSIKKKKKKYMWDSHFQGGVVL